MIDNFQGATNDITLFSTIKAFQQETFAKLNCMRIGVIDEILEDNKVRCSITNKKFMSTNKDGSSVWRDYPQIFARVWYMGSGEIGINYPLTVGTPCLLLFNDREIDSYFETGQISTLNDFRMHSLNDCICIPMAMALSGAELVIKAPTINIVADTINIQANDTINLTAPNVIINGIKWEDHKHGNGNQGQNTTGVVK